MDAFPFTDDEWQSVKDATLPVVNAELADDPVLRDSHLIALLDVLSGLRVRHGDHPVLLETQADFTEDDSERISLYRRVFISVSHGLPTLSIRLSLARVLLDSKDAVAAMAELLACEDELSKGDESEEWADLVADARVQQA